MVDIRIKDLPLEAAPNASEFLAIDLLSTRSATIQSVVEIGRPAASQAEAEAGTNPTKVMTPLTVSQAVSFYGLTKAGNLAGLASLPTARSNLGVAIGSDVQAFDAGLASIAGLTTAADQMIYTTASDVYATTSLTPFARTILDDADATAVRTTIGLGTAASPTFSGLSLVTTASAQTLLTIDGDAGSARRIQLSTAGVGRWFIQANAVAETGSNAGSNFEIVRRTDAGANLGTSISIARSTGKVTFEIVPAVNGVDMVVSNTFPTLSSLNISATVAAGRSVNFQTSGVNRWIVRASALAETGANAGSDFEVVRRDDTGATLGTALFIQRSSGIMTLQSVPVIPGLPNLSSSVQGTGVPGLDGGRWMIWNSQTGASFDTIPTLRLDRNASPTVIGGVSGNTYQALKINGTAGVNNQGYEWPLTVELHNKSLGTLNSQNVAINATAWVEDNGVGQTGRTWGANLNVSDLVGTVNPTYGRVGLELNNYATETASTDANRSRAVLQLAFGTVSGANPDVGTPLHFGRGILVGSSQTNIILDRLLEASGTGTFDIGFDTSAATFTKPVYFMAEAQRIAFDGNSSGVYTRSLRYQTGELVYETASGNVFTISDTGSIVAEGLNLTDTGAAQTLLSINGDAATARRISLRTGGVDRWFIQANAVAETGANAGSNFEIVRRTDAGANLGTPVSISRATGVVTLAQALTIGSTQVVSTRVTGWTAATGTATRTTFATGTVTTTQLAERVKAIIDDLITHGLIGA